MTDLLAIARQLTIVAEKKAIEIGITIATTMVDNGGNLVAFSRMTGTQLASSMISQGKAYSAVAFKRPSRDMFDVSQPGQPGYALQDVDGRFVFAGGGMPVIIAGELVGGLGISGGSADEDQLCAEVALASLS
ncbi:MAG: heme-binding protein [Propionibacteriaceae bacterium]|jgi:uncharacterized protein GlcG (DUF336 family)|nr:heme-binding protein [Propionibacteriaceae bacterium]